MATLFHPTIPDISTEVDAAAVDAWVEQGWLKTEPKNAAVEGARKATAAARRADRKAFASAESVTPGVTDIPTIDASVHGAAEPAPESSAE